MKLLQAFWKLFKKSVKKEKKEPKKIAVDKDFSLKAEPKQLVISPEPSPPIRKKIEKIHIQVGLDFGTSCTKFVFSQQGRRFFKVLSFKHNLPIYPNFSLPSLAAIDKQGELLLGTEAAKFLSDKEWDFGFQRFKVIVAGNYDDSLRDQKTEEKFYKYRDSNQYHKSFTPEKLTSIYIAYAMKEARSLITKLPEYEDAELDIAFNICMPIEHIENNSVRMAFEDIFTKAEAIELAWQDLGDSFNPVKDDPSLEHFPSDQEKRVFAIPEAIASIASYLISLRREDGLHAVIDLGAGTTDISICNLVSPGGESQSIWYAAKNLPFGTINIERLIADFVRDCHADEKECKCSDVYEILLSLRSSNFSNGKYAHQKAVLYRSAWDELGAIRESSHYRHAWGGAYNHLKSQTKWEKVEVFLCGGGASLPFASDVFSIPWWDLIKGPYQVSRLPIPDDYDSGEADAPFERMAVAYGLAIPKPSLETYTMPKDAPDQTPPKLHYVLPDRDEIYAK